MKLYALAVVTLMGLTLLAGCGGGAPQDDTTDLVPTGGQVTLDGQPLAHASVQFIPTSGTTGQMCYGTTDEAGNFTLSNPRGREGCSVGQFKVVISKFARKDGSPLPPDIDGATAAAEGMEHLPPTYSNADASTLTADVPQAGKTDFLFELTAK